MTTVLPSCAMDGAEKVVLPGATGSPRHVLVPYWFQ